MLANLKKTLSFFFTYYSTGDAEIYHLALTILSSYNKDILFANSYEIFFKETRSKPERILIVSNWSHIRKTF